ncbi:MAG: hypothetical protein ACTMIH_04510, partial [Microbacterium gubbeenense]
QNRDDRGGQRGYERRDGGYRRAPRDGDRREGGFRPGGSRDGGYRGSSPRDGGRGSYGRDDRREGFRGGDRRDDRGQGDRRFDRGPQRDDRGGPRRDSGSRFGGDRREGGYGGGDRRGDRGGYERRDDRGYDRRDDSRGDGFEREDRVRDPELPDEITPKDLMPSARNELKTLTAENAERVARHVAMAAQVIDDDPELAHEHAQAAMRHAGRVGVVRETLAITAYATGDFSLALRELRTVRRITGRNDHAAMIVDSERGVGRPEKALEEGRGVKREDLPVDQRVELAIALSGARLDLGQTELALHELDIPEDDPDRAFEWSAGLFAARAAVLSDLGRDDEAAEWTRRADVAGDAVASRLAEGDTVEIEEIYIPSLAGDDEQQGFDSDDEPVAEETGDASTDENGADDEIIDAVPNDDSATEPAVQDDTPAAPVATSDVPSAESAEADASTDDTVTDAAASDELVTAAPAADMSAADDEPAADVVTTDDVPTEEISPDDIVVDDQSISDEVAELLAAAGITDDDEDGAGESDEKN